MTPIASSVAIEAAMMRSPSFSRRSSSVTITIRPGGDVRHCGLTESKGDRLYRGHPDKMSPRLRL